MQSAAHEGRRSADFRSRAPGCAGATARSAWGTASHPLRHAGRRFSGLHQAASRRSEAQLGSRDARIGAHGRPAAWSTPRSQSIRDGSVSAPDPQLERTSGKEPLDNAAMAAIHASNPFEPLPTQFHGPFIRDLRIVFLYNVPPGANRPPVMTSETEPHANRRGPAPGRSCAAGAAASPPGPSQDDGRMSELARLVVDSRADRFGKVGAGNRARRASRRRNPRLRFHAGLPAFRYRHREGSSRRTARHPASSGRSCRAGRNFHRR